MHDCYQYSITCIVNIYAKECHFHLAMYTFHLAIALVHLPCVYVRINVCTCARTCVSE